MNVEEINKEIAHQKKNDENFKGKDITDGHHTFGELYHCRMVMSAVICNSNSHLAWKSKLHDDGSMFDDSFIVGVETPDGSYTNHYHMEHWDMFTVEILDRARPWDGHTADDIGRLLSLVRD